MTDRELLQLAAKAAWYTLTDHYDVDGRYWPWCHELERNWCPLGDDGDALRLAVKLCMVIDVSDAPSIDVAYKHDGNYRTIHDDIGDASESVRRAITLCAAEIGRRMG